MWYRSTNLFCDKLMFLHPFHYKQQPPSIGVPLLQAGFEGPWYVPEQQPQMYPDWSPTASPVWHTVVLVAISHLTTPPAVVLQVSVHTTTGALVGAFVAALTGCFVGWLLGELVGALTGFFVGWLLGELVGALTGCFVGWLLGELVGALTGYIRLKQIYFVSRHHSHSS